MRRPVYVRIPCISLLAYKMNEKRRKAANHSVSDIIEEKRRTAEENRRKIQLTNLRQNTTPISEALLAKLAWPWPKSREQLNESFKRLRIVKIMDLAETIGIMHKLRHGLGYEQIHLTWKFFECSLNWGPWQLSYS